MKKLIVGLMMAFALSGCVEADEYWIKIKINDIENAESCEMIVDGYTKFKQPGNAERNVNDNKLACDMLKKATPNMMNLAMAMEDVRKEHDKPLNYSVYINGKLVFEKRYLPL